MGGLARRLALASARLDRLDYKWRVLAVVSLANFISTLDASVVATALPSIRRSLDITTGASLWIVTAYLLTSIGLLLIVGRLSDAFGRKRWFIAGLAVFNLGTGLVATSQDLAQIVGFRILAAAGGAMMLSSGIAILTGAFPEHERGRAMGLTGILTAAGLAVGPLTIGPVLDHMGWRAAFYLRLPIGVANVALAILFLRESRDELGRFRFDLPGALTIVVGLVSLVLATSRAADWGVTSAPFLALLCTGIVSLALFVLVEPRAPQPIFDLGLFLNRTYASAMATGLVYYIAIAGSYYLLPFYLVQGRDYSSTVAGLLYGLLPIAMMLFSPVAGVLTDRLGTRVPVAIGVLVMIGGLLGMAQFGVGTPMGMVALIMLVAGMGAGLAEPSNNSAIMGAASRSRLSVASASLAVSRQVGLSMGVAIASALFESRREHYEITQTAQAALVHGFDDVALITVAIAALALVGAITRGRG